MKIDTIIMRKKQIRIHTLSGEFDFDTLFQAVVEVYNQPEFDPTLNSVWDFSNVDNLQKIALDQMEKIVAYVVWKRSKYGKIKTAIVVSGDIDLGLATLYERGLESANKADISIFRNVDDALAWLT